MGCYALFRVGPGVNQRRTTPSGQVIARGLQVWSLDVIDLFCRGDDPAPTRPYLHTASYPDPAYTPGGWIPSPGWVRIGTGDLFGTSADACHGLIMLPGVPSNFISLLEAAEIPDGNYYIPAPPGHPDYPDPFWQYVPNTKLAFRRWGFDLKNGPGMPIKRKIMDPANNQAIMDGTGDPADISGLTVQQILNYRVDRSLTLQAQEDARDNQGDLEEVLP